MGFGFNETIGTAWLDSFLGDSLTINYGLSGNDIFRGTSGKEFQVFVGGSGSDTYHVSDNSEVVILDAGNSSADTVIATGIGFSRSTSYAATIDNRHLIAFDTSSGQSVLVFDWLSPKHQIEVIHLAEGDYLVSSIPELLKISTNFVGNMPWEDFSYNTAEMNEVISFIENRALTARVAEVTETANGIYRFYNRATGTHFYTASFTESTAVISTLETFDFEGVAFKGSPVSAGADIAPVYRFYNTATGTHFYTISEAEKSQVISNLPGFNFEGKAFDAHTTNSAGTIGLHRFYNTQTGTHFYTASETEMQNVQNTLPQFNYEGLAYYVDWA